VTVIHVEPAGLVSLCAAAVCVLLATGVALGAALEKLERRR
jgi:hypothetical protein